MKLKTILSAASFAAIATLSFGASAADTDKSPEAKMPAAEMQGAKTPAKATKRHSHMEEKTGIPASQPAAEKSDTKNPAMDTSKHLHPRDGK